MTKTMTLLICFVGAAIAWAATLGWDTTYQHDPVTGVASGPYQAWQVLVLGAIIAALGFWAGWNNAWAAIVVIPIALVAGFLVSVFTSKEEQDGLFMVGALLLLIGSAVGTAVMVFLGSKVGSSMAATS